MQTRQISSCQSCTHTHLYTNVDVLHNVVLLPNDKLPHNVQETFSSYLDRTASHLQLVHKSRRVQYTSESRLDDLMTLLQECVLMSRVRVGVTSARVHVNHVEGDTTTCIKTGTAVPIITIGLHNVARLSILIEDWQIRLCITRRTWP